MHALSESLALLSPKGTIALAERALMLHAVELMLIVIIPVFILLFFFAWHYRAGNTKAVYMPNWEHAKMDELIWWAIPFEIVLILGALTWTSTHQLAPNKLLTSDAPQIVIEVVALEWKWLFIYPEEGIASVNYVRVPVGTPVTFKVTADAPMNSFWIPRLGGQIYAMTGMVNSLNLIATEVGTFPGASANYSGDGFAQMKFNAEATSQKDFDAWVERVKAEPIMLDSEQYEILSKPSNGFTMSFGSVEKDLYNTIVGKFMSGSKELLPGAVGLQGDASGSNSSERYH